MNAVEIGKKLKLLRAGKSVDEVSSALNISKSSLFMYERGERVPRDEVKIRIAQYYKSTVEEIFFSK